MRRGDIREEMHFNQNSLPSLCDFRWSVHCGINEMTVLEDATRMNEGGKRERKKNRSEDLSVAAAQEEGVPRLH